MELTKEEHLQYKDLVRNIFLLRVCFKADYKLSYKREKNGDLFYYLSVFNYRIVYKNNRATKFYTSTYTHYSTYKKMLSYIGYIQNYYTQMSFKELKRLLEADNEQFRKNLRAF